MLRFSAFVTLVTLSFTFFLAVGCSGGGSDPVVTLVIGRISGPIIVGENSTVQYSVDADGDTGITYQWVIEPSTAGTLENAGTANPTFTASQTNSHLIVKLSVKVNSANASPVTRSINIEIRDIGGLEVSQITGPSELDETSRGEFSVVATSDIVPAYKWSCFPDDAGWFLHGDTSNPYFFPSGVGMGTEITLSVEVTAGSLGPLTSSFQLMVTDSEVLEVFDLIAPDSVEAGVGTEFSISATGDSGISFEWAIDPTDAGYFEEGNSSVVWFVPDQSYILEQVGVSVTVSSKNYDPILADTVVTVRNYPEYLGGCTSGFKQIDYPTAIAVGPNGNVYVAGEISENGSSIGWRTISALDSSGTKLWDFTWGQYVRIYTHCLAGDSTGNLYISGTFVGTCDFDPSDGVNEITSSGSYADCFLSKFDPAGNHIWTKTWGGANSIKPADIALDSDGNIYIAGEYKGIIDFAPGVPMDSRQSHGYEDYFLTKYLPDGSYRWTRTWGGPFTDICGGVAVDSEGNTYSTGSFENYITIDSIDWSKVFGEKDVQNHYIIKHGPGGTYKWIRVWPMNGYGVYARDIAVSQNDMVTVLGKFSGLVDFDPGAGVFQLESGEVDPYLSQFNPEGIHQWTKSWTGPADADALGVDSYGNIVIAGDYNGEMDFDPDPMIRDLFSVDYGHGICLSGYDNTGDYLWTRVFRADHLDSYTQFDMNQNGVMALAGSFRQSIDLDPGESHYAMDWGNTEGANDIFLSILQTD